MNILVTGGNGYIAKSIVARLKSEHVVTSVSRQDFDLTNEKSLSDWLGKKYFDVVLHTAIVGGNRLIPDRLSVLDENLSMYFNLVNNKDHFGKLITFGSGSQYYLSDTPHGKSKAIINESVKNNLNFYDLRIFGVFDENELPTRFIKANITRYIKKEPMIIHTNKIMDFIYMQDLISTVEYYINNADPIKDINCCYEEKYTLKTIANIINSLDRHKVPIVTENENQLEFYCGESGLPPINIIGLRQGIQNTFRALST